MSKTAKKITVSKIAVEKSVKPVKKVKPIIIDEIRSARYDAAPEPAVSTVAAASAEDKKTRALDFIIFGSLFLIFLLCPLFFTGLTAQGAVFEKMILFNFLVLIGAVAWAIKMAVQGEIKFKRTVLDLPILAVLSVFIISTITSVNQWISFTGFYGNSAKNLIAVFVFVLFYYLIVNNTDVKKIKILFWAFVSSLSAALIYSLSQTLGIFILPFDFTHSAEFNSVGSSAALAQSVVIALPVLIFAAAAVGKEQVNKIKENLLMAVFSVISLIGFILLAVLNKIVFWPAAIAGLGVLLLFFLLKKIKISNNNLIIPITAFLLAVIFLVLGNFRVGGVDIAGEAALKAGESWQIAKSALKENPFFGSGPATFYYDFSKFKSADFNMSSLWNLRFTKPSGFLFDLLASVGILGALAALSVIVAGFLFLWKAIRKGEERIKNISVALFSSLISSFILALFLPVNDYIILVSVIIFGLAFSAAFCVENENKISIPLQIASGKNYALGLIFIALLAGAAVIFTFSAKTVLADFYARIGFIAEESEAQAENLERAVKLAPRNDIYRVNLSKSRLNYANKLAGAAEPEKEKILLNLSQAVAQAEVAVKISPEKAANNEFLALVYENASSYEGLAAWAEKIKDAYKKAAELEPNNPVLYYKLALVSMSQAETVEDESVKTSLLERAVENYNKTISLKSDFAPAYYGKGIISEKASDLNKAIEELKSAVEKSGGNIDYAFELGRVYLNRGIAKTEAADDGGEDETREEDGANAQQKIKRNEDINIANQTFLSILQIQPNHANALYSLAMIYQAVGEDENMKIAVGELLSIITDESQQEKIREQFKVE